MFTLLKCEQQHKPKNQINVLKAVQFNQIQQKSNDGEKIFFYNDHITNQQLPIDKDQVFLYLNPKERHSHQGQNKKFMKQCYELLRSTRKFHLNSLQAKNYKIAKSIERSQDADQQINNLIKSKVEKCLQRRREEHKDFSKQKQKLSKILTSNSTHSQTVPCQSIHTIPSSIQRSIRPSLVLQNSENVKTQGKSKLEQRFGKQNKEKKELRKKKQVKISQQNKKSQNNLCLKRLVRGGGGQKSMKNIPFSIGKTRKLIAECTPVQRLIKESENQIRSLLRKKGEYLIMPKVGNRINRNSKNRQSKQQQAMIELGFKITKDGKSNQTTTHPSPRYYQHEKEQSSKYFRKSQLDPYLFKLETSRVQSPSDRSTKEQAVSEQTEAAYNKVIAGIEQDNYYRVEIQLSLNPCVLKLKQNVSRNNLLHFCVMSNREQIFGMILKKCMELEIDLATEKNKYGRTPIELGNMMGFFRRRQIKELIKKIEKEKVVKAYHLIATLF